MIHKARTLVTVVLSCSLLVPLSAHSQTPKRTVPSAAEISTHREIIVKFKNPAIFKDFKGKLNDQTASRLAAEQSTQIDRLSIAVNKPLQFSRSMSGDAQILTLTDGSAEETQTTVDQLNANAEALGIEYAVLNGWRRIAMEPTDPRYAEQWHYQTQTDTNWGANLPGAWDIITGSTTIRVAVLDTGILFDHPDLQGRTVGGYDFVSNTSAANDGNGRDSDASDPGDFCNPDPSSWHGSHVAGTIGAATNNGIGVAGINWVSKVLPVRVLGQCGGSDSDIIDGMRWAAGLSVSGVPANPNPARVLNLSLGGYNSGCDPNTNPDAAACKCPTSFQNAVNEIVAAGAILAIAAGNEQTNARASVPGNCAGVITVGATDRGGDKASYSNFDSSVEISAPGGETAVSDANGVLSTLNAGTTSPAAFNYVAYQGTSMATPHVAGIASLILSVRPELTPAQVLQIIQQTATPFAATSDCTTSLCGAGVINAAAAVAQAADIVFKNVYMPITALAPAPIPTASAVKNGTFDAGREGSWTQYSIDTFDIILSASEVVAVGGPSNLTPQTGNYVAWLGGLHNENGGIHQQATIDNGTPFLQFYQQIRSQETTCTNDQARIKINGTVVKTINLCLSQSGTAWVKQSVDLSAYKGKTVKLEFNITTNSAIFSNWFVDSVSLQAAP